MIILNQYYWTCPHCGSNLDPGDSCDCQKNAENSENLIGIKTPLQTPPVTIADDYKVVNGGVNE